VLAEQTRLIEALSRAQAFPDSSGAVEVIETHISWVILTGRYAYKIKKAVKLPFLDFATLERREHYCRIELELNRRLAPELYLEVVPIAGPIEHPDVGATPAIEYAVKMIQFPKDATAERLILRDTLSAPAFAQLAARLAAFHESLAAASGPPPQQTVLENLAELESYLGDEPSSELAPIASRLRALAQELSSLLDLRGRQGSIKECHGDLHLANIARIGDELIPFDCLEFDRQLRTIDVIDEVAFLYMDLKAHRRPDLAFVFLNRYLEARGDYQGLTLLGFYAAHRALVRAKVARLSKGKARGGAPDLPSLLSLARAEIDPPMPALLITCGLSGSGKSTVAGRLAPALGAVHVRSDVERKRLAGLEPLERSAAELDAGIYSADMTVRTYERLAECAEASLRGRVSIIVDASFLTRAERQQFAELAAQQAASFVILYCTASEDALRQRIGARARRGNDPSEADEAVLDGQLARAELPEDQESAAVITIDTEQALDTDAVIAAIERRAQSSSSSTSY
jgi:hypothetical protein